jgi:hypothetical protein
LRKKKKEEEELELTLSQALRPAQASQFEQLLASNLATAIFSPPLEKIRMIFEAWQLLPDKEKEKIVPEQEEREKIKRLYEVCISFVNLYVHKPPIVYDSVLLFDEAGVVPWSFPISEAPKYLELFINKCYDIGKPIPKEFDEETLKAYFVDLAKFLNDGMCSMKIIRMIISEYITVVMPKALELLRIIHEKYISPEVWERTLMIMSGKMPKKEKGIEK